MTVSVCSLRSEGHHNDSRHREQPCVGCWLCPVGGQVGSRGPGLASAHPSTRLRSYSGWSTLPLGRPPRLTPWMSRVRVLWAANSKMYCKASVYQEGMNEGSSSRNRSDSLRAQRKRNGTPASSGVEENSGGEVEATVRWSDDGMGVAGSLVQSISFRVQPAAAYVNFARQKETLVAQAACSVRGMSMGGRTSGRLSHTWREIDAIGTIFLTFQPGTSPVTAKPYFRTYQQGSRTSFM